jgi:hypothetical protein
LQLPAALISQCSPFLVCPRFANLAKEVILRGLGENTTGNEEGDKVGTLYDDGARAHEDRYAGDGLYSNTLILEFKKTNVAVYKEFYVSLLDKLISSTVEISGGSSAGEVTQHAAALHVASQAVQALRGVQGSNLLAYPTVLRSFLLPAAAITTDYDTLLQVFPTQARVADAQKKLDSLLAKGTAIDEATQQVYDTLLQQSSSGPVRAAATLQAQPEAAPQGSAPWNDSMPLQPIDMRAIVARIDRASLQKVSERCIEFRTTDGFPCLVLAMVDYSKYVPGGSKCKQSSGRKLLLHTSLEGGSSDMQQQQQQLGPNGMLHANAFAAAAAAPNVPAAAARIEHGKLLPAHASGSARALLRSSSSQCATPKGEVLVLAPFFAENSCAFGDESADVAALFQAAGYRVTFKCNKLELCPGGPPALDDFTGWSKYAFVAVSTIGDADAGGEAPIILARAPTDFSAERMQDWQAGCMVDWRWLVCTEVSCIIHTASRRYSVLLHGAALPALPSCAADGYRCVHASTAVQTQAAEPP